MKDKRRQQTSHLEIGLNTRFLGSRFSFFFIFFFMTNFGFTKSAYIRSFFYSAISGIQSDYMKLKSRKDMVSRSILKKDCTSFLISLNQ